MELMRLYSTDLRTGSDSLLDLGTTSRRWKNLYLFGTANCPLIVTTSILASSLSAPTINASSMNAAAIRGFTYASAPTINASTMNSAIVRAFTSVSSPTISCSSTNAVNVSASSSQVLRMTGSSMALNNGTNSCINMPILISTPPTVMSGNFWFFSSSNFMYLGVTSNSTTYYVQMAT